MPQRHRRFAQFGPVPGFGHDCRLWSHTDNADPRRRRGLCVPIGQRLDRHGDGELTVSPLPR